jgi:cytochrome c
MRVTAHPADVRRVLPGSAAFLSALALLATISIAGTPARAADAANGRRIFGSQCTLCHSPRPGQNVIGPSLFGVVGRHSGVVQGFQYSQANRQSGLTWDPATLDRYLASPRQVVPGTLMTYAGLKDPMQRSDLIAFLSTLR